MPAENERVNVFDANFAFHGNEGAHASGVEYACHAKNALLGEAAHLERGLGHGVERIGDHDNDAIRRMFDDLFNDGFDDVVVGFKEIIAAHAGLARESGGDHNNVAIGCARVIAGRGRNPDSVCVSLGDWRGFEDVERFAGGRTVENIGEDDVGEFHVDDTLRGGRADKAAAYHGYFFSAHSVPFLRFCRRSLFAATRTEERFLASLGMTT